MKRFKLSLLSLAVIAALPVKAADYTNQTIIVEGADRKSVV